jgi:multidrug resistance efflux pump
MNSARVSLSLMGIIGVLVAGVAAAAIWLSITNPVSTASGIDAATQGDVSPILKSLAGVLYEAFQGLIKYL